MNDRRSFRRITEEYRADGHGLTPLDTPHEWQRPPASLSIDVVLDGMALVSDCGGTKKWEKWASGLTESHSTIEGLHLALRDLFLKHSGYLNAIPRRDLIARLGAFVPQGDWSAAHGSPGPAASRRWEGVESSDELWMLANHGHALFEHFFPPDSNLRALIDRLPPGSVLEINWQGAEAGRIPNLPWGLMYAADPGDEGSPIDPEHFLGLKYRIDYRPYVALNDGVALGAPGLAPRAHLFYHRGLQDGRRLDPIVVESIGQDRFLRALGGQEGYIGVPDVLPSDDPDVARRIAEVFRSEDGPSPPATIYTYCQCGLDPRGRLRMYFGQADTEGPELSIEVDRLLKQRLVQAPLVFVNACGSAGAAGPMKANQLETGLFRRGCRAYLGAVDLVPNRLASRFAQVFFHFFCRRADAEGRPMAAGEAVAQARRFLWNEYRNLGGLYYSYVNRYQVYLADEDEVRALIWKRW